MSNHYQDFLEKSELKSFDLNHRKKINFNISQYDKAVARGKSLYSNLELAKQRAAFLKYKVVNNLETYITEFEYNFKRNGGQVVWAQTAAEAVHEVLQIIKKYDARKVVKSKSMITEEIELNHHLEQEHIESLETDLGEYIVQIAGERPYHIITPIMHKSKEDVAELFHEKFNTPEHSTPQEITAFVRNKLRDKFVNADIGITGANFLIADIGGVGLTENEGNGILSVSFPKVHIVIAGFEKVIPSVKDLQTFWPLLATHGTGQNVTVYNSILTGPKKENETDGPLDMYVILLDNGRSNLLARQEQRRALSCIRCGACLNGCPIYRNIGGHAYEATYSGPIGAVIMPHLGGIEKYKHLSYASSLCGNCSDVCPVKIPLHKLLLYNRRDFVKEKYTTSTERMTMAIFKKVLKSRKMMDIVSGPLKNIGFSLVAKKLWGPRRELPKFSRKSFNKVAKSK